VQWQSLMIKRGEEEGRKQLDELPKVLEEKKPPKA
jgi:hypothetical protein